MEKDLNHYKSGSFELDMEMSISDKVAGHEIHTATAAAWVRNPIKLKRSSPCEARATPDEIMKTMTASFLLGSWRRNVHWMRRIATGVKAYSEMDVSERSD